jgi:hypothetical protein
MKKLASLFHTGLNVGRLNGRQPRSDQSATYFDQHRLNDSKDSNYDSRDELIAKIKEIRWLDRKNRSTILSWTNVARQRRYYHASLTFSDYDDRSSLAVTAAPVSEDKGCVEQIAYPCFLCAHFIPLLDLG